MLPEAFEAAEPGTEYVITRYRQSQANLRTQLIRIIQRAGLTPWAKLWHNMRASRQSELMAEYSLADACRWIGNSPVVAARHYAVSPDTDAFRRAAGSKPEPGAPKSAPPAHQNAHQQAPASTCTVRQDRHPSLDNQAVSLVDEYTC